MVLRRGEDREGAWQEVFGSCADGCCPVSLEPVGEGLAGEEWSAKVKKIIYATRAIGCEASCG